MLERFGLSLSRSSCLNYLHRLGFVLKWSRKRLVKADQGKREGGLDGGLCPPVGRGVTVWSHDILC